MPDPLNTLGRVTALYNPLSEKERASVQAKTIIRIVDDDDSMRDALDCVLTMEGWQTRLYSNAVSFLHDDSPFEPGVILMDVLMPEVNGLEALERLNFRNNALPVLFLSGHADIDMAVWALKQGAFDFVEKPINHERLLRTIECAASHSLRLAKGEISHEKAQSRWALLTPRERDIARYLARGLINREIAETLGIALRTVEVHRQSILKKCELKRPDELALLIQRIEGQE